MITTGPVVGGVTSASAVVFVRVSAAATVQTQYSTLLGSEVFTTPGIEAVADSDFTVQMPLSKLLPDTVYYYRILIDDVAQTLPVQPHFTTFPNSDAVVNFSIAVVSDSLHPEQPSSLYQQVANENPAFVMQIGDFDHRNPAIQSQPPDIDNWRRMHRDVLHDLATGQDFATYIGPAFPFFHMWDDHDYGNNNADRTAPWRDIALQAFKEYYPLPPLPRPNGGLWYTFRYAQAQVFMLDLHTQRDPYKQPDNSNHSMLDGATISNDQKDWLKAALLASTARWKFIVSTSVWNSHSKRVDSWYNFQTEQHELVDFIRNNGITGVLIMSGDLHSNGGIDNGANSYFPEISVPIQTVKDVARCTGGICGDWSEGIISDMTQPGYALITVQHDAATGADRAILQAKGEDGSVRISYTVTLP